MTLRYLLASTSVTLAVVSMASIASTAAADEAVRFDAALEVVDDRVITTVTVPQTAVHEYIARAYTYDVYGTCWNRRGRALPEREERIGGGRIPGSSGDYQLRVPPSEETAFTFSESVQSLLNPAQGIPLRTITCPAGSTPGPSRIHVRGLEAHASSFGSYLDPAAAVDHHFDAPVDAMKVSKTRK